MTKTREPTYTGHRQRIKGKYKKSGIDGWLGGLDADREELKVIIGAGAEN